MRVRGSQFKVESVLFKLSKPESFMMLSPNRVDVSGGHARAHLKLTIGFMVFIYAGWPTERCGMSTSDHGASVCILQRTSRCTRFPILVSVRDDSAQLLLLVSPSS